MRHRAAAKIHDIDEKLRSLRLIRRALQNLMERCTGDGPAEECPILAALEDDES